LAAVVPAWIAVRRDPPPSPAPQPVTTPSAPALPLQKLTVRTPPGASIAWRDGGALDAERKRALAAYEAGDLGDAVRRLSVLAARDSSDPAPGLYLGVAHLLRGAAGEAAAVLEGVPREEGAYWTPHVEWYLAVAHERAGRPAAAGLLLRSLCRGGSEYAQAACVAAPRLPGP
jgi:hypothetical protein